MALLLNDLRAFLASVMEIDEFLAKSTEYVKSLNLTS
jgi:hypothetical protein